ncbi:MAG: fuculose phosphate aldolase [Actinobacteria bacterium HGW-Actinobacteria-10]|jgi:L-fuculose-phosphate aldolase|nr:MAG: fuculose phosphate aldolase [Actinobacteria bacterium HGW-Actinobacteria-10]
MYEQFRDIGQDIYTAGLISSHGGNMSVRVGDRVLITRRGSMLGRLTPADLIETALEHDDSEIALASTEIVVHRAIYRRTNGLAIVHTHSPNTILRSMIDDEIIPIDSEASYLLHKVPVYSLPQTAGSSDVADTVSEALRDYKCVVLRGHGPFAIGTVLEEAFQWISSLEMACNILNMRDALGIELKEYREHGEEYGTW